MRKEIRRLVMFCTILTAGLLILLLDVTFIQLLLIVFAIALILPFLLGLITFAEVKDALASFRERLKKVAFLKKLDEIKLFEKKGAAKPSVPVPKAPAKPERGQVPEGTGRKIPFSSQIGSLAASFKSLGTLLRERIKKPDRKVSDINTMLDKAVTGSVESPAATPAAPARESKAALPAPGGAGSAPAPDADPFLSLSDDEFDAGLLDGLEDMDGSPGAAASAGAGSPGEGLPADMGLPEPELSPEAALDAAANDILKSQGVTDEGLDGFSGLEAGDGGDEGSELGDLDNLSLDDVDLDAELGDTDEDTGSPGVPSPEAAAEPAPSAPADSPAPAAESSAVKTAWIPSDAPKDADLMQDQIGTQADMASFAGGASGTDEDLLSSIASDVKKTVKEKDVSLLRELKDFKAPANQIEKELTDMYAQLSAVKKPKDKSVPPANEIK